MLIMVLQIVAKRFRFKNFVAIASRRPVCYFPKCEVYKENASRRILGTSLIRLSEGADQGEEGLNYKKKKHYKWFSSGVVAATGVGYMVVSELRGEEAQEIKVRDEDQPSSAFTKRKKDVQDKVQDKVQDRAISAVEKKANFIFNDSYRRRVFFKYEQRLRLRSSPEKVFDYFSSVKNVEGQTFMTPGDLMRAIVPVFPPSETTCIRVGHLWGERPPDDLVCPESRFFMLFDMNGDGLISFSEYIFFVTLLSIPQKNFRAAFKMFDLDGNGTIDKTEFKKVMGVMRSRHRQGVAQRDGRRTGLKVSKSVEDGGLLQLFFGEDGTKQLRHEDFEEFLKRLHEEITNLEFAHYDFEHRGTISAWDFALSVVASADITQLDKYLDRVNTMKYNPQFQNMQISLEEFHKFAELRQKLPKLVVALDSFGKCHELLTKKDFQRATCQVCKVSLSHEVVEIIYHVFGLNRAGNLNMDDFLGALHRRKLDTAHPIEAGLINMFKCWWSCVRVCKKEQP